MADDDIMARFGEIWPVHVDGFTSLLARLRVAFDGDLDCALIMAVIGGATLPRSHVPASLTFAAVSAGAGEQVPKAPLNALSIADITGIPRESVRRKLERLAGKGWVERDQTGHWRVSRQGSDALRGCTEATLAYLGEIRRVLIKA